MFILEPRTWECVGTPSNTLALNLAYQQAMQQTPVGLQPDADLYLCVALSV